VTLRAMTRLPTTSARTPASVNTRNVVVTRWNGAKPLAERALQRRHRQHVRLRVERGEARFVFRARERDLAQALADGVGPRERRAQRIAQERIQR
jgi:hypothetical protein